MLEWPKGLFAKQVARCGRDPLVSEQFYDYSKKRQWGFRDLRVLNDHLEERTDEELARVYSDHGGLAATFDYYPA